MTQLLTKSKQPPYGPPFGVFLLLLLASGCDVEDAKTRIHFAAEALMGNYPKSVQAPKKALTESERRLQEDAQLLHEIFQVVLLREPYGAQEFGGYMNSLSQGASLEGIYNGLVNGDQYRKIEELSAPADPLTLGVFAKLIAPLQKELSHSKIAPSDLGVSPPYEPAKYGVFARASLFKLKRVLGDEAMKVLASKSGQGQNRDELAQWYSGWVVQMASFGLDYGLPLRNKADVEFHKQWVKDLKADQLSDRVLWEVLNRVHRLLNQTEAVAMKKKGAI